MGDKKMEAGSPPASQPKPALKMADAIALIVGIVVGAGIFRTPSLVAAHSQSNGAFLLVWVLGGFFSLLGALCYAELSTTFPNTGGDYHFLARAYGRRLAFLFAWARMSVIQTGSIALLAFIIGDYLSQHHSLGPYSPVLYASGVVILLTGINILGLRFSTGTQRLLTLVEVTGMLLIAAAGFFFAPAQVAAAMAPTGLGASASFGMAMVFVLLTFGGWSEAAYVSAELRAGRKGMARVLVGGIVIITAVYLLVNLAYLKGLGLQAMSASDAVASDLMQASFGKGGALLMTFLVCISALTSANATIFTGARTNYALGRDFRVFSALGKWNAQTGCPVNAFIVQGLISLALLVLGLFTRKGFETIVEYTAPVFWFFFLLVGIALFVLRRKEPMLERPFRVPFYPFTPLAFCLTSAYLLFASLRYTGLGALVGMGVLLTGVLVLLALAALERYRRALKPAEEKLFNR